MILKLLRQLGAIAVFSGYFAVEVVIANLRVAADVATVRHYMRPAIVAVPLEAKTDFEIAMLANLISLTPGTLSLDVAEDRKTIFVHAMYVGDIEEFKRFEARFLRAVRWN